MNIAVDLRVQRLEAELSEARIEIDRLRAEIMGRREVPIGVRPLRRMADILREFTEECGAPRQALMGRDRTFYIAHLRQELMLRMSEAGHRDSAIARFFGRDHTTVRHAKRVARVRRAP